MSSKKYSAAMEIAEKRLGMPNHIFERNVVSNRRKDLARQAIRYIKYKINDLTKNFPKEGNSNNRVYSICTVNNEIHFQKTEGNGR